MYYQTSFRAPLAYIRLVKAKNALPWLVLNLMLCCR